MTDTQLIIVLGTEIFTVLINECTDDTPWLAGYGATKNGVPCDLHEVDVALAAHNDCEVYDADAVEAAWDRILFPALAAAKAALAG